MGSIQPLALVVNVGSAMVEPPPHEPAAGGMAKEGGLPVILECPSRPECDVVDKGVYRNVPDGVGGDESAVPVRTLALEWARTLLEDTAPREGVTYGLRPE